MRLALVHNAGAGGAAAFAPGALLEVIREAGHEVRLLDARAPGWEAGLDDLDGLVVVGGDGTVGRVAKQLAGRDLPIAPLPAGTANNISKALGLTGRPFEELVRGWAQGRRVRLDIGEVQGPWGRRYVVEGIGAGLFALAIPHVDASATMADLPRPDVKVAYTLQMLKERVDAAPAVRVEAALDGADVSGEYLLFEAMIMPYVGPNLYLAPDCRPGDGQFDLVMVTADERSRLSQCLASWQEDKPRVAVLPTRRGRRLEMRWKGELIHIDDDFWPGEDERPPPGPIHLRLTDIAVSFLVSDGRDPTRIPHPPA